LDVLSAESAQQTPNHVHTVLIAPPRAQTSATRCACLPHDLVGPIMTSLLDDRHIFVPNTTICESVLSKESARDMPSLKTTFNRTICRLSRRARDWHLIRAATRNDYSTLDWLLRLGHISHEAKEEALQEAAQFGHARIVDRLAGGFYLTLFAARTHARITGQPAVNEQIRDICKPLADPFPWAL
jgi:hypothetical protein